MCPCILRDIQHIFVGTLEVAVVAQLKQLCLGDIQHVSTDTHMIETDDNIGCYYGLIQ